MEEKKYPIGGFAPGNYHNRCSTCERSFFGDKQAVQCEPCALEAKARFDALSPEEQEALIKKNASIAHFMFSGPLTPERDLIYRIVEQWGNAVEMPNMEQWLKDYAATRQPGAVWVKASEFNYEFNVPYHAKDNESKGAGRFNEDGCFMWGDESITLPFNQGDLFILDESGTAAAGISQDAHEKEIMMQAFDKVRQIFVGRQWIMEGRGSYPYNDDRYQQEVRYMYDEFDQVVKDTWANIKSKSADYRKAIIAEYLESPAAGREEDACDFAEWMRLNCKSSQNGWVDALGKWDTTKGWYELFKQQKEK